MAERINFPNDSITHAYLTTNNANDDLQIAVLDGDLVILDANENPVLRWDASATQWDFVGGDIAGVGSLDTEETHTKTIGSNGYHYAGDYDGADADARLDNAISAASAGEVIYLEAATYSDSRTISEAYTFVGSNRGSNGTFFDDGGSGNELTIDQNATTVKDVRTGGSYGITVDAQRVTLQNVVEAGGGITVATNNSTFQNISNGSLTFQNGTIGNVVDTSTRLSVTDNGSNTVGDVS